MVNRTHSVTQWWELYREAEAFKARHGHTDFPPKSPLYRWRLSSEARCREHEMDDDQIAAFENLRKQNQPAPAKVSGIEHNEKFDLEIQRLTLLNEKMNAGTASPAEMGEATRLGDGFRNIRARREYLKSLAPPPAAQILKP